MNFLGGNYEKYFGTKKHREKYQAKNGEIEALKNVN